jgi:hypothetical protein
METTPPTCPGCAERDVLLARLEANVAERSSACTSLSARYFFSGPSSFLRSDSLIGGSPSQMPR